MARWIVGGRVVKKSVSFAEQLRSGRNEKIRGVGRVCFSVFFFFPSFFIVPRSFSEKFLRVALEPVTKFLVFASDLERGGLLWPSLCDFLL